MDAIKKLKVDCGLAMVAAMTESARRVQALVADDDYDGAADEAEACSRQLDLLRANSIIAINRELARAAGRKTYRDATFVDGEDRAIVKRDDWPPTNRFAMPSYFRAGADVRLHASVDGVTMVLRREAESKRHVVMPDDFELVAEKEG